MNSAPCRDLAARTLAYELSQRTPTLMGPSHVQLYHVARPANPPLSRSVSLSLCVSLSL